MSRVEELSPLLYGALAQPIGLLLKAEDVQKTMKALHQVKYKMGDPALLILQIRLVEHPEGNIAITKSALPSAKTVSGSDKVDPNELGI